MDFQDRIALAAAAMTYVQTRDELARITRAFSAACDELRKLVPGDAVVVRGNYGLNFLVSKDEEENISVREIETI